MNRHSDTDPRGQRDNSNISGGRYALLVCLIITALAVVAMGLFVPSDGAKNPIEAVSYTHLTLPTNSRV